MDKKNVQNRKVKKSLAKKIKISSLSFRELNYMKKCKNLYILDSLCIEIV
jgi:hypothetical protein